MSQVDKESVKELKYPLDIKFFQIFMHFIHPDNRDNNIIKVFSEKGTLICGVSVPKEIPVIHKCKPGLQDLSLNTKLFAEISSWSDYKILKPDLEVADYDYEHE